MHVKHCSKVTYNKLVVSIMEHAESKINADYFISWSNVTELLYK